MLAHSNRSRKGRDMHDKRFKAALGINSHQACATWIPINCWQM